MEPGTLIGGRFELEAALRAGGMSTVYRARDRADGKGVALKLLTGLEPSLAERFTRECAMLEALRHPSIVRHLAHGEAPGGGRYLAMEWLEGRDLGARLDEGALSSADALAVVRKVAEAVATAHDRGVVHRDLKPSNIFLVEDRVDRVKVLDFGIAAWRQTYAAKLTRTGVALGTPGYMPPEQARGDGPVDPRADVYALGCVLFHALAGRGPFESTHFMAALVKSVMEDTPRLSDVFDGVSSELDALTHRLMAKAPADRPADARAVCAAIDALGEVRRDTRLVLPPRRQTLTRAEQRVSSVVLLSSYPPGPADANAVTRETVAAPKTRDDVRGRTREAAKVAERFHGHFELLLGDALMMSFEGDPTPTDQAARAARGALALRELFPTAAIVLATGRRAATMSGAEGEVVHRAVERLELAHHNRDLGPAIFVDETTFGLLEGRFEIFCTPLGHVLIDEQDPLHAERKLLGRVTPCVGRARELTALTAAFVGCTQEPTATAMLITGPPGIGKSRIRQAFVERLRGDGGLFELWLARADAMRAGSPFGLVTELVRAAVGLRGGESLQTCQARLRARLGSSEEEADVDRVVEFLSELIGGAELPSISPHLAAARDDPLVMGDQLRRAFVDLVAEACRTQPVLLVLEDLHWGDAASVRFVDAALRTLADRPVFVLATARPEFEAHFGKVWSDRGAQELRLGPLAAKASRALVEAAAPDQDREVVEKIVERAAGHPLLLEEMLRAHLEQAQGGLPDTALAVVEARLLALDEEARRILRAASVFGRTFWADGVQALTAGEGADVAVLEWLQLLAGSEWIIARPSPRFPGEVEYAFTQDLVRQAAYAMLTDDDRALGHRLAGRWLAERKERDHVVLARHHELGLEPARAAARYERAAERALDGGDFEATLRHGDRALALGGRGEGRGRVRALRAEAQVHLGAFGPAVEEAGKALDGLQRGTSPWCRAVAALAQAAGKLGDVEAVRALTDDLLDADVAAEARVAFAAAGAAATVQLLIGGDSARAAALVARLEARVAATPDPEPALRGHTAKAISAQLAFTGDPGEALRGLRDAVEAFEQAGDARSVCSLRKTQGWYAGECGALEEGERALLEAIGLAERLGLPNLVAHAMFDAGSPLIRLGRHADARRLLEAALVTFRTQGDQRLESGALGMLSWVERAEGHYPRAVRRASRAVQTAPSDPVRIPALAFLAAAQLEAGETDEAATTAARGHALLDEVGVTEEGTALLDLAGARALHLQGQDTAAHAAIRAAKARVLARAEKIADPSLRASFLRRIEEHREILELADAWLPAP